MTIINASFDYAARIRKHGHRKTSDVMVRDAAPFEIPDFVASTAPVALRMRRPNGTRADGSEKIRSVMDGIFAPLLHEGEKRPLAAAEFGPEAAELHTELCETALETLFVSNRAGVEIINGDPVRAGHHLIESDRERDMAEARRRIANALASIDGILHMRIPEPMYVVTIEWERGAKTKPAVFVDFDQTPGFRCPPGIDSRGAVGHFRLDQRAEADRVAEIVADKMGFRSQREFVEEIAGGSEEAKRTLQERMRRANEPDVGDAALLRAGPMLVTLEQTTRSLLRVGHEALVAARDEFVLAWADMRESLTLLDRGHADAASMAADAVRSFLAHAPTDASQFATAADKRRWETRTLPLLQARIIVIDELASVRPQHAGDAPMVRAASC
jgi:hypothetical protein